MPHFWLTTSISSALPTSTLDIAAGPAGQAPSLVLFVYDSTPAEVRTGSEAEIARTVADSTAETVAKVDLLSSSPWTHAAAAVNQECSMQYPQGMVRVLHVLPASSVIKSSDAHIENSSASGGVQLDSCGPQSDSLHSAQLDSSNSGVSQVLCDAHNSWPRLMQLPKGSAVLVRPDGHIAWRFVGSGGSISDSSLSDNSVAVSRISASDSSSFNSVCSSTATTLLRAALQRVLGGVRDV